MKKWIWTLVGFGLIAVLAIIGLWIVLPVLSFRFTTFYLIIIILAMLTASLGSIDFQGRFHKGLVQVGVGVAVLSGIAFAGSYLISASFFHWETQKNMLKIEPSEFNQTVSTIDTENLVVLDESDAIKFSEKLITEKDPALGSMFEISETYGTLSVVDGKPYWLFPLEHSGFFKWLSNQKSPGYLKVNATTGQSEFVEQSFKVAPSAYLANDLKRAVYLKFPTIGLTDYSFEIDDQGKPYWVVTAYTHKTGVTTTDILGAVIVDAATGEMSFHEAGKQPVWVDRVYPLEVFEEHLGYWGEYVNGWWNPSDTGKLRNTEGYGYVFSDGDIYFYTGMTSYGGDEATTGFMIYNPRTGDVRYNRISGSTETKAVGLMEELVQNAGYTAKYPYLINMNGEATYFSTLKGNSGNIVGYAFASVQNYRAVAWGKTMKEAQTNYARALMREGSATNALGAQTSDALEAKGQISRVGLTEGGYYFVKLIGQETVYIVSSEQFPMIALSKEGDMVTVQYLTTEEKKIIDAIGFVNQSIQ